MRIYFTTIVWLLTVRGSLPLEVKNNGAPLNTPCKSASVDQTAYTGDSVSFTCKYSQADKNSIRNFCRLDGNNGCANIISAQLSNYTKLAKISLSDDKQRGLYKVDISMVTQQDSGKYWCALKKDDFITCLQEVVLHVLNPVTVQTYPEKGESPLPPLLVKIRSNRDSGCDSDSGCDDEKRNGGSKTDDEKRNGGSKTDDEKRNGGSKTDDEKRNGGSTTDDEKRNGGSTTDDEKVTQGSKTDDEKRNGGSTTDDEKRNGGSKTGMIAGIVCGVVIVVVLAIVLILCRRKLCNRQGETSEQKINTIQSAERNDRDHQYEEIQMQNKQANTVCTLYSTVNPPADQLHYASVNIQGGDPTTGSDQNASAHPPAETTLYSTVTKPGE